MLNVAFMIDNLLGNNLRFQTTGSEINHKIKALSKLNLLSAVDRHDFPNIRKLMPGWNGESITFMDLYNMIHTTIPLDESMQQTIDNLSKYMMIIYTEQRIQDRMLSLNGMCL